MRSLDREEPNATRRRLARLGETRPLVTGGRELVKVTITLPIAILRTVSLALCPLPLAVLLGASALSATSNPARLSTEQEAELIQRLKETEEQDERNAADPSVGTIAGEDFLEHAVEVKGAINELRNGLGLPSPRSIMLSRHLQSLFQRSRERN